MRCLRISFDKAVLSYKYEPKRYEWRMSARLVPSALTALMCSSAAFSQQTAGSAAANFSRGLQNKLVSHCSSRTSDEVVVCGSRNREQYRIPRELRGPPPSTDGAIRPRIAFDANGLAPCGLFQGERRCGRREAAQYGYVAGRDPLTFVRKLIGQIVDPKK